MGSIIKIQKASRLPSQPQSRRRCCCLRGWAEPNPRCSPHGLAHGTHGFFRCLFFLSLKYFRCLLLLQSWLILSCSVDVHRGSTLYLALFSPVYQPSASTYCIPGSSAPFQIAKMSLFPVTTSEKSPTEKPRGKLLFFPAQK